MTVAELQAVHGELSDGEDGPISGVSLGTPHASASELARAAILLNGRRVAPGVEFLISTGRDTLAAAEADGTAERLRDGGADLLVDTCSYISPILRGPHGRVMTDSGKWAYYAAGNIGATVLFGSMAECVESAVAGRVVRHDRAWGEQ